MLSTALDWVEPLAAANAVSLRQRCWVLLYSGQRASYTGRYSFLCMEPLESLGAADFTALANACSTDRSAYENAWFGYLAYELVHTLERLPREKREFISVQDARFHRFGIILRFDHDRKTLTCFHEEGLSPPGWLAEAGASDTALPQVTELYASCTREAYLRSVRDTREAILRGDFYQANITRKFMGRFASAPSAFALFERLCAASPATYSALLCYEDFSVISSSPERFLTITADGLMESRPIKGTAARKASPEEDAQALRALAMSAKDRAENLMIVDLMRNDLAKSCVPGSIEVHDLFEVTSYATLHHMASTITGRKREGVSTAEAVKSCFPPGSMTGAPKIRAMRWCMEQEGIKRGVYSGALGWFGGDGSCDLSVVIRTLILQEDRFEFQVGGGIVADSDPEAEWRETMTKARGILKALGLPAEALEAL